MPLTALFIDLNAFFASVEQQLRPELRGRPVGVVPVMADSTCCIAASYEARPYGIKTGTRVSDARRLCPEIVLIEARTSEYVRMHRRVLAAAEKVLPVDKVWSVDEFSCRMLGAEREPERALALARAMKDAIREHAGSEMKCSAGIAPNRYLAKVASDMQKPDGLTLLQDRDLPHALHRLELPDLPGVGPRMHERLQRAGVHTVEHLCSLPEKRMREIWGGVSGEIFRRWLKGEDLPEARTVRRSIGHQHVLPPALRSEAGARAVAMRLLHKAAARARAEGYDARGLLLHIRLGSEAPGTPPPLTGRLWTEHPQPKTRPPKRSWAADCSFPETADTQTLMEQLSSLWSRRDKGTPLSVSVTLTHLVPHGAASAPLFAEAGRRARLAETMDRINRRCGRDAVHLGAMLGAKDAAPDRIAFGRSLSIDEVWREALEG